MPDLRFEVGKLLQPTTQNLGLYEAVASNDLTLVKQLLEQGADVCAEDEQVCTTAIRPQSIQ